MNSLIVMESPWRPGDESSERLSVVPFFQGMANAGMVDGIYNATFYDANTFNFALKSFLASEYIREPILYIASHGSRGKIATPGEMRSINISSLISTLSLLGGKIKGVVLGCCLIGGNKKITECFDADSKISWIYGYSCKVDWYYSTIVDVSVVYSMVQASAGRGTATESASEALKMFNPNYVICEKTPEDKPVTLKNAFRLYVNDQRLKDFNVTEKVKAMAW